LLPFSRKLAFEIPKLRVVDLTLPIGKRAARLLERPAICLL
jgi:hypothetical protein